jgi:hypothetical protein
MSSVYTPSKATFTVQVTLPSDGDAPTAASVNTFAETNADNIAYLEDKAFYGEEGYIHVPLGLATFNTNSRWTWNTTLWAWVQNDNTSAGEIAWPVQVGIKGRIAEVLAEIEGAGGPGGVGHGGGLPATMPIVTLYRIEYSAAGNEVTAIGATADPAAGPATYDAVHTFGSSIAEDIDENRSYFVTFQGEAGANSLPDELLLADIRIKLEAAP